jgi:hypothetical protein
MEISIKQIAGGADTAAQGELVLRCLEPLKQGDQATVSFEGVTTATSSFVNAAFVSLLSDLTLEQIRKHLRIVRSSRQINDMIKTRLEREAAKAAKAAI